MSDGNGVRARLARLSPEQRAALEARLTRTRAAEKGGPGSEPPPFSLRPDTGPPLPDEPSTGALSDAQRRLWVVDHLDPGNPAYTLSWAYRIVGDLDAAALAAAFDALVDRHPILGYVIETHDGEPRQVPGRVRPTLRVETMSAAEADAVARDEARFAFDLSAGPLTRARLVRVASEAQEHRLILTLHHILADRWSVAILFRDLFGLYAGEPLPARPVAYADYVAWQQDRPSLERDLDYWRKALDRLPDVLDLPADRPRPPMQSNRGRRLLFELDDTLAAGLRDLAAGQRATPFMVLVTAMQALLARYTGQPDIPIGTPMSARPHPSLDQTVGLFLNTVVLRGDLSGDPTFTELVRRTRERTLAAFDHAGLPFETLVEELSSGRDLSRNPLFQVMLAYQNTPELPGGPLGLRLERLDVRPGTVMFDLDLIVEERPDGSLLCVLDYATDLFDDDRAHRLAAHLRTLLSAAVAAPDLRLSELPLMDTAELRNTLHAWNDTATPYPDRGIHHLVAEQAARSPEAPAVEGPDGTSLTYAELESRANDLAAELRALAVGRETRVAVCLPRHPDMVAALLAVLKAGGCYVPLDPGYPPDRLNQIITDSGASLVVTVTSFLNRLPATARLLLLDDHSTTAREAGPPAEPAFHPDQAAYLIYTSGSTGRAKGVVVPHRGLVSLLWDVRERPGLAPGGRFLFLTSVSFDIAMIEIFGPLVTGGTVVLASATGIERVHDLIQHGNLHTVQATPSVLEGLLPALTHRVPRVISTGEALPGPLAARLLTVTDELWDLYGPTETTVWSTRLHVTDGRGGSIGRPVANTAAYVVDRDLRPVPVGVPGELLLGGAGVTRGYHGRAALTAERFIPDPFGPPGGRLYRTGDLARWRPDGTLEYLGRLDDQVKVRGVRIELDEVATVLSEHPTVQRAVVTVRDDAPGGRGLVAYVIGTAQEAELRAHLRTRLPEAMIPAAFVSLPHLPVLPSGKLDRAALPPPGRRSGEAARQHPPRTPAEHVLHAIWTELLERDDIGIEDDFFTLGGHSLLAMRLVVRLRETYGAEVTLRRCFATPTIAGLAPLIPDGHATASSVTAGSPSTSDLAAARPIPPASGEPARPSHAQVRLWFLDQLDPGNPAYNVAWAERLIGPLDVAALTAAFDDLVDRHDALRLVIVEDDGEPVLREGARRPRLVVRPGPDVGLEEARHRFDLAAGPLARAALVRCGAAEHELYLTLHHVVADRWSLSILLRDLMELYRARVTGTPAELPTLTAGYRDFAAWHRARVSERAADLAYWKDTLADLPATLDLPADRHRQGPASMAGRRLTFPIDAGTVAAVQALARERQVTPFMVLLAAFQAVLARYTGRTDIPVGTPVSGRAHPDVEEMAGLFLNTLVLRGDLSGEPTFAELLSRTRERVLDGHDHAELPFEVLVQELAEERDLARNPLFQVMLAYQNVPPAPPDVAGIALRTLDIDPRVTQADLHLVIEEAGDRLTGVLHYAKDLFEHDRMERFADHFRAFLAAAVAEPERPVADLPLLTPAELDTIHRANDTGAPAANGTLPALVAEQAARTPHAPALGFETPAGTRAWLTYAEFADRVNRLARRLRALGSGPGHVVGVCLERGADLVIAVHAVVATGAAYLPLEPDHPAERLAGMMTDAGARLAISVERFAHRLPRPAGTHTTDAAQIAATRTGVATVLLDRDAEAVAAEDGGPLGIRPHPDSLAYVIFTSGSTGRPKGVGISHRAIVNRLHWMQDAFRLTGDDRVLHKTPFSFDVSVWELFWPLMTGAGLVVARHGGHADPAHLACLLESESVTTVHFVPSMLDAFLAEPGLGARLGALRTVVCSGEALGADLAARFAAALPGAGLHNLYGPTEAAVDVSWHACRAGEGTIPIGRPVANTRLEILDDRMNRVPLGVPGHLWIGGVQLARGYAARPALTAERFVPDPYGPPGGRLYDTGDLARWRPDGEIEYLGRSDHQVKIRGMRVELGEIETALAALPGIRAAAVRAIEDGAGLRLAGYVVPTEPTAADTAAGGWERMLRDTLPDHMIPRIWTVLGALPLNRSGKLDRNALPDPRTPEAAGHTEPEGAAELAVAAAWQGVLGLERVSAHDNFFAVGGDSIRSLKVVARLREAGYAVRLEQLFRHQTVRELAGRLLPAPAAEPPEAPETPFGLLNPEDLARLLEGEAR
ncbi:amino acid adenylation domain-containing protein [Nonomuraea polychroma]|uniref:Amino acid adenylation domain-containing protein n=1 Tax=Nonomuraea polychroma TaxID=46176 RepID=A0A438LZP3_9ACTN|nr:non-ribosomal peptide synthetase [Nonomuraea polychroma]RVX39044.1 amino acid adenylation domain-containing protein [Nonomuraea polychroma]